MARNFDIECPECGSKLHIQEFPMGVAGGKEKESVDCPKCRTKVYEAMTDGRFEINIIHDDTIKD